MIQLNSHKNINRPSKHTSSKKELCSQKIVILKLEKNTVLLSGLQKLSYTAGSEATLGAVFSPCFVTGLSDLVQSDVRNHGEWCFLCWFNLSGFSLDSAVRTRKSNPVTNGDNFVQKRKKTAPELSLQRKRKLKKTARAHISWALHASIASITNESITLNYGSNRKNVPFKLYTGQRVYKLF